MKNLGKITIKYDAFVGSHRVVIDGTTAGFIWEDCWNNLMFSNHEYGVTFQLNSSLSDCENEIATRLLSRILAS